MNPNKFKTLAGLSAEDDLNTPKCVSGESASGRASAPLTAVVESIINHEARKLEEDAVLVQADLLHAYEEICGEELDNLADALETDRQWNAFMSALNEVFA